jgi:hypothetical protein
VRLDGQVRQRINGQATPLTEDEIASVPSFAVDQLLPPSTEAISLEALQDVAQLLRTAWEHGMGVAFEPDGDGWRISYIIHDWPAYREYELPAGQLSNAYDLHIAAAAALKPLVEMGERADKYFEQQDEEQADEEQEDETGNR